MDIWVTGASGFLGRHVVEALVASDHRVFAVSRQETIAPATALAISVNDYAEIAPEPKAVLVHLAENNLVGADQKRDEATELLDRLLEKPFDRVIYASSATVYGDQNPNANTEDQTITPNGGYAQAKAERERHVLAQGGTVLRIANVYGPGMSNANVLSDIMSQLDGQDPVQVRDDTPVRDYIWAEDVGDAVLAIVNKGKTGVYNIGSGVGVSVRELAQGFLALTGQNNREIVATAPSLEASNLVLDTHKTTQETDWSAKTDLTTGLKRLLHV